MKDLPYLPEFICLCMIIAGVVSYLYPVNELRVGYTTDYMIDPQTGRPIPYSAPYYYEVTVYPYRNLGLGLIFFGSILLLLSIIADKLIYKRMRKVSGLG